jgi:hypothetical protein
MKGTAVFAHPLTRDQITEENYREVADHLFRCQLKANIEGFQSVLEYGWGDDDTDYIRTALDATGTLMDIAYDGSRQDLVDFLWTLRNDYDPTSPQWRHEPLHYIDSAGGLCEELEEYTEVLYREEEAL